MGPHFRARPRAEPRQPARCRRRRSVTGAPYVRASVFRRGLSVWHERKRKEKEAEPRCACRFCWIRCVVVVVSFVWANQGTRHGTSIENCVPRCARSAPVTLTFDGRERTDTFARPCRLENNLSYDIVGHRVSEAFVDNIRSFEHEQSSRDLDFVETTATWRRGTTLTLTLLHETHCDATTERQILSEIESRSLFTVIFLIIVLGVTITSVFHKFSVSRGKNISEWHLVPACVRSIPDHRSNRRDFSRCGARLFFFQYQIHPLRVSAIYCAPLGKPSRSHSLNGCACDDATETREMREDGRIE